MAKYVIEQHDRSEPWDYCTLADEYDDAVQEIERLHKLTTWQPIETAPECQCSDGTAERLWCLDDVWTGDCENCGEPAKSTVYRLVDNREEIQGDIDEDNLPSFSDLYGIAPNATNGVPAEKFIAGVRADKPPRSDIPTTLYEELEIETVAAEYESTEHPSAEWIKAFWRNRGDILEALEETAPKSEEPEICATCGKTLPFRPISWNARTGEVFCIGGCNPASSKSEDGKWTENHDLLARIKQYGIEPEEVPEVIAEIERLREAGGYMLGWHPTDTEHPAFDNTVEYGQNMMVELLSLKSEDGK